MSFQFYEETILCALAAIGIAAIFREIALYRAMHKIGQGLTLFIDFADENSLSAQAIKSAVLYCFPCLDIKTIRLGAVMEEDGEGTHQN